MVYCCVHNLNLPMSKAATINVGAGQYMSSNVDITKLPTIPPSLAATIDIATPVALFTIQTKAQLRLTVNNSVYQMFCVVLLSFN